MIRVAALKQQVEAEVHKRSDDGKLPEEQLAAIFGALHGSLERQMRCLDDQILPGLERHGIRILPYEQLDNKTRAIMHKYFDDRVFPVLTPLAIDQSHPFPYISNLSLSLAVELEEASRSEPDGYFARVKVPGSLPRFVPVETAPAGQHWFVMLEDLIANNLGALFPGMKVKASYGFRVTRDADLDLQQDEADDLLRAIESELRKRRFGEPVRLEVNKGMPEHLRARLLEALSLGAVDCYAIDGMLATSDVWTLHAGDPQTPDRHDRFVRGDSRSRSPAAPSLRVVRSRRSVRESGGQRSRRARDQANLVPDER